MNMLRMWMLGALVVLGSLANANIVELTTSKFSAHYGYLRHLLTMGEVPKGFTEAVGILTDLEKSFPDKIAMRSGKVVDAKDVGQPRVNEFYWRSIDVIAFSAGDSQVLRTMPDRIPRPIGGVLSIKTVVGTVERALAASARAYEPVWAEQRIKIKDHQQIWSGVYAGRADDMLQGIAEKLKFEALPKRVEIVVLPFAGGKEGMTLQTQEGWKVVIGAHAYEGSAFAEVILHEAAHVMDLVSGDKSFLGKLRKALIEAKRSESEVEQIPHLLIFMSAAQAMNARDKNHRPVGEQTGAYARLPKKLLEAAKAGFEKLPDEDEAIKAILNALDK